MPVIWEKMRYAAAKSASDMYADDVIAFVLQVCRQAQVHRVEALCSQLLVKRDSFRDRSGKDVTGVEDPLWGTVRTVELKSAISALAHALDIGGAGRAETQVRKSLLSLSAKSSGLSGPGDNARSKTTQSRKVATAMEAHGVSANIRVVRVGDVQGQQPRFAWSAETDIVKTTCNR